MAFSQNVGVSSSGAVPAASAGLDVNFTDKGLLVPRIALTATNSASPITSPATSLLIYNTATAGISPNNVVPGYYFWNGASWSSITVGPATQWTTSGSNIYYNGGNVSIGSNASPLYKLQVNATTDPLYLTGVQSGSNTDSVLTIANGVVKKLTSTALVTNAWSLSGNSSANTNFLGTTNNQSLRFKTNGIQRLYADSLGSVAVGANPLFSATAREKFLVDAGGSSSSPLSASTGFNAMSAKGYINNYLQLNVQNLHAGTASSSDVVASNDVATETANFIDMGINSSANTTTGVLGGANTAYLYSTGNDFAIGNASAAKNLIFFTGGTGSTERMRISSDGNVGIATSAAPTAKLDVNGTFKLGTAGTALSGMFKTTFSVSDAALFTNTRAVTATVTGANVNASLLVNPRSSLPNGVAIAYAYVSAANTVTIGFMNSADLAARSIGSITFDVTVIQ